MGLRFDSVNATMLGIAGLAALLGFEAARTAREHRHTAERVLVGYAALGAEGVATRLERFLNSRLYPILDGIRQAPPPTRDALVAGLGPGAAAFAGGLAWAGRVDDRTLRAVRYDTLVVIEAGLADSVRLAAQRLPEAAYFGVLDWGGQLVVFARPGGAVHGTPVYAIPMTRIAAALDRFLDHDPVLPPSLTRGASLVDGVGVVISLGAERLASRAAADSTRFHASHSMGPIFGDMSVEVRLAEALAPALVIGGLPRSRLPFLAAVVALTLALAIVAARQLRQKERLARLRQDFVVGASHEFRTPLAQLRLFAETLRLKRIRSDAERTHALVVIERETLRLELLVENLLRFSSTERGSMRLTRESVDLSALTREIVAEFAPLAEKAGVGIGAEGPEGVTASVDPGAWRQVVLNLLDNAVKYGGRESRVTVGLAAEDGFCRLSVADEGPGVPPADRERIWEPFWRGDAARSAGITGTGIGLATVRGLVTLHGGQCWVERAGTEGARFVVRVPGAG
jgi:signal transduction histidine kinase